MMEQPPFDKDVAALLHDHYQKTYELTLEMWKYRNRTFLYLVGTIGFAGILTFPIDGTRTLFADVIAGILNIQDAARISELRTSFPFELFQTILMVIIFYLMVNLYHRSHYVLMLYQYLGGLEPELRARLHITDGIAFTREGDFYWNKRPIFLRFVKFVYFGIIGTLLSVFFSQRFADYLRATVPILQIADAILAGATAVFFIAYIWSSLGLDKKYNPMRQDGVITKPLKSSLPISANKQAQEERSVTDG